jgi:hypothetical protein
VSGQKDAINLGADRPTVLGINIDPKNGSANPSAEDVLTVGATRVRIELKVDTDDAASPEDELGAAFAQYDATLAGFAERGITVLLILDYASLSRDRYGDPSEPGYRDAFASRAASVAAHYQGIVDHFEIWNEEDLCAGDYCPRLEVGTFASLLGSAATAIHDASPGARVATGGLASGEWETYLGEVVAQMGPAWDEVDAVGAHPYTFWPASAGAGGNVLEYQLRRLRDIGQRPLWLTEWGDGGSQFEIMTAYFDFFADTGIEESNAVDEAYLFAWSDTQQGGGTAFGLFNAAGEPKREWSLFQSVARGERPDPGGDPGPSGDALCSSVSANNGWEGGLCGADACAGQGVMSSDCDVCCAGTSRLHGAIVVGGEGVAGVTVSAFGQADQDFHETTTDGAGVFVFEGLNLASRYNLAVNARFEGGQFVTIDQGHDQATRDNVSLVSGPDGWHGENFSIGF